MWILLRLAFFLEDCGKKLRTYSCDKLINGYKKQEKIIDESEYAKPEDI